MRIEVQHHCSDFNSYRAARVKSLFNAEKGCDWEKTVELPIEDREWQIGLIVGPSGSGKTSIGNKIFKEPIYDLYSGWDKDKPIVDCIAPDGDFNTVTGMLSAVGLGDVPAWLRPFHVLSNGEKFRAGLARLACERPQHAVVDEFTSVIDRQIAKVGAAAFSKTWRRGGGQIVLLSCHYDIIEWLQPDWVYDTAEARFYDRDCLRQRPKLELQIYKVRGTIFPRLLINMIKTAELTGDLPETLDDMADYYRETEKTRKQMVSAVTYPVVVLLFAIAVLIFIMVGVIPQFVGIYSNLGTELPGITVAVINLSNFLKNNWMYLLIGVVAFVLIFVILFKTIKVFKTVIQSMLMNLPVIGKIIIYNEITMFTKTFASLLNHNVYITDCMEVLSKITNNEVYKMLIFDTITNLAKGEAISNSFKNHWAFPNVAYEMILTGEKTGQLGTMMDRVANYYQEQHKNAVNQIKAFIEPIMIVILAGIVGTVLLSVVLPMFDMYQGIT